MIHAFLTNKFRLHMENNLNFLTHNKWFKMQLKVRFKCSFLGCPIVLKFSFCKMHFS